MAPACATASPPRPPEDRQAWNARRLFFLCMYAWLVTTASLAGPVTMATAAREGTLAGTRSVSGSDSSGGGQRGPPPTRQLLEELGVAARQCLDGKLVQLVGNSVTRHWLFVLNDLVNGGGPNLDTQRSDFQAMRQDEKDICGGSEDISHMDGTGCKTTSGNGSVHLEFVWQHPLYSNKLGRRLTARPTPDIVIANLGIHDLYQPELRPAWKLKLVSKSDQLAEALGVLSKSSYVYWRTTTRLCYPDGLPPHSEARFFPLINRCLTVSNAHMVDALARLAPKVHIFDSWEMTKDCRGYGDHIHHPVAAIDHVLLFMSRYCGSAFATKAVVAYPQLAPLVDGATGAVRPRRCWAQRAALADAGSNAAPAATKDDWSFEDGWDWVEGLHSPSPGLRYSVPC